jgi:predicted Zn-dependent protease
MHLTTFPPCFDPTPQYRIDPLGGWDILRAPASRPEESMPRSLSLCLAVALALGCATSPLGRSQLMLVTQAEMDEMGATAFAQYKAKLPQSGDATTNRYVTCVADDVTGALEGDDARYDWEVVVFEDPTANAFALPGGKIGVHTGLLKVARNQDQLATVIGHEVAHVLAGHGAERVSAELAKNITLEAVQSVADPKSTSHALLIGALGLGAEYGAILPYSRAHESEADLYGLDLMANAGFDPRQSVELWKNMAKASGQGPPEFLSTHPSPETRIEDLSERIPEAQQLRERARAAGRKPACAPR